MTPSNPSNSQPLIYRIMDALGVSHLVACINHTHEQSEVDGLVSALAGKQATLTFDSTPTVNSTNPVTSGGVKAALNDKLSITTYDDEHYNSVSFQPYFGNSGDFGFEITIHDGDGTEKSALISFNNIDNLSGVLGDFDAVLQIMATKVSNATANNFAALDGSGNIKDSGKKASDFSEADHTHSAIYGEGAGEVDVNNGVVDVDAPVKFRLTVVEEGAGEQGGDIEHTIEIDYQNIANLARALKTPDSTPTINSTNLVTSGGVAAAIANAQNRPVTLLYVTLTNKINVTQLENDRVYSAYTTQNISIAECFTGGTINWIGTLQTESHPGFFFRFYKVPYEGWGDNYYIEIIATKDDY